MDDLEARIGALYAAGAAGFIAARDALAKELRAAGERDAAERVRALRRPSKLADALNRTARQEPAAVARLVAAEAELARVQRAMVEGAAGPGELRAAEDAEAAAVSALSRDPATRTALRFAARGTPDDLRRGVLARDPGPEAGGGLAGGLPAGSSVPADELASARTRRSATREADAQREAAERAEREAAAQAEREAAVRAERERALEAARAAVRAAQERARDASEALEAVRDRAREAARERDRVAAEADELRARLAGVQERAAALGAAADDAEAAIGPARTAAARAAQELAAAESAAAGLEGAG